MNKTVVQLLLAMLLWGGAWPFAKFVSNQADLVFLISSRFVITSLALLLFLWFMHYRLRVHPRALALSLLAAVSLSLYNVTFFLGLRYGLASVGGVLVTTLNPIFTYFAIAVYQRKRLPATAYLGLGIGLLGGAIIMEIWSKDLPALLASGNIFFLACAGFWVMVTLASKASEHYTENPVFSFYTYLLVAIIWLLALFFIAPVSWSAVALLPWDFWGSMIYLSVVSVGFATTVYFLATRRLGAKVASSYIFTVPVGALLGSWLLLGEVPRATTIIGGMLNLGAVYYLNHKNR